MNGSDNQRLGEMLEINNEQKEYYEVATGAHESRENSRATNLWRRFRRNTMATIESVDVWGGLAERYRDWVGDLSDQKVLDLGVGGGNLLSIEFAQAAREYVAIDLSESRVEYFGQKLKDNGVHDAKVLATDFLSDDFAEHDFDLIYAMSVMHHFKHVDAFLDVMHRRLAPGGLVISLDPLETWLPIKLLRAAYRPFQTDKAWEFPFTNSTLKTIGRYFEFEAVQGFYQRSKWAAVLSPFSSKLAMRKVQEWHAQDWEKDRSMDQISGCLRVAFALRRRDVILDP